MTERLAEALAAGDPGALARAISIVEDGEAGADDLLARVRSRLVALPHRIGITGAPGVGKSSLVRELARTLRAQSSRVAILAVDPSSPRSGGALLGDRIRLGALGSDEGIFFRSMASRQSSGGLGPATLAVLDLIDGTGVSHTLVETVGVGQLEGQVATAVDTVAVVMMPGQGDAVQAMKSGLVEIADLLVINKADLPGADQLEAELREAREFSSSRPDDWKPPVIRTVADGGEGVVSLLTEAERHRLHLVRSGEFERRRRRRGLAHRVESNG
ncbi:MAG: methylmalonyl Co-A mutase-associated GTPase MeaB [Gemmatimonadota bacterium]